MRAEAGTGEVRITFLLWRVDQLARRMDQAGVPPLAPEPGDEGKPSYRPIPAMNGAALDYQLLCKWSDWLLAKGRQTPASKPLAFTAEAIGALTRFVGRDAQLFAALGERLANVEAQIATLQEQDQEG